jgi:hypothetical protein
MGTKTLRNAYQTSPPGGDATVEMPHRMSWKKQQHGGGSGPQECVWQMTASQRPSAREVGNQPDSIVECFLPTQVWEFYKNPTDSQGTATTIASATVSAARYGHIRHSASSGDTRPIAHAP